MVLNVRMMEKWLIIKSPRIERRRFFLLPSKRYMFITIINYYGRFNTGSKAISKKQRALRLPEKIRDKKNYSPDNDVKIQSAPVLCYLLIFYIIIRKKQQKDYNATFSPNPSTVECHIIFIYFGKSNFVAVVKIMDFRFKFLIAALNDF